MWEALKAAHTSKHPYVEIGLLRRQLYSSYYMKSKTMDEWFSELEQMCHALERLGRSVSDDEFTQVMLFGVVFTHRDIYRQFTIQRICSDPTKSELEKLIVALLDEDAINKYIAEHRDEWMAANRRRPGLVEANGGRRNKRR